MKLVALSSKIVVKKLSRDNYVDKDEKSMI
jgi:hypothetical protein